ncbi:hypothetical protein [Phascolarctobacterium succinatutens]|uniref:Uncharacterized protein n=1 Tax=Phascolarctobacterium succinatutens TaxID=626940 RepID=A0A1Q6R2H2_9FIRM|nr:hypothetical protein [Phascolarctobacterium succinatutens]OLA36571.1 MAG: hypothetical protein BHW43_09680 [Phascolarctobacterium succinatutens]
MMNIFQMMQMVQQAGNPMGLMQQFAGQNPLMSRAMQMGQGKSPEQIQNIVRNLAKQKGMNDEQLNQFLNQFGLKLQ